MFPLFPERNPEEEAHAILNRALSTYRPQKVWALFSGGRPAGEALHLDCRGSACGCPPRCGHDLPAPGRAGTPHPLYSAGQAGSTGLARRNVLWSVLWEVKGSVRGVPCLVTVRKCAPLVGTRALATL